MSEERRADYPAIKEKLAKIEYALFGNGSPGIDEQVRQQKNMIEAIQQELKETKEVRKQIVIGVTVGVVLAAMNLIMTLVRHA